MFVDEEDKTGQGKGNKSVIIDRYVQAQCQDPGKFKYLQQNPKFMKRERNSIYKLKEKGDRILAFIQSFGTAILLAVPSEMSADSFRRFRAGEVRILVQALQKAPWSESIKTMGGRISKWLP